MKRQIEFKDREPATGWKYAVGIHIFTGKTFEELMRRLPPHIKQEDVEDHICSLNPGIEIPLPGSARSKLGKYIKSKELNAWLLQYEYVDNNKKMNASRIEKCLSCPYNMQYTVTIDTWIKIIRQAPEVKGLHGCGKYNWDNNLALRNKENKCDFW